MTTETDLGALQLRCAEAEKVCPEYPPDRIHGVLTEANIEEADVSCPTCKGTGKVARVPGLRRECWYKTNTFVPGFGHTKAAVEEYHKAHREGRCPCKGQGFVVVTSLNDAMVAAQKAKIYIEILTLKTGFAAMEFGGRLDLAIIYKTPDLAFWNALHEVLERSE